MTIKILLDTSGYLLEIASGQLEVSQQPRPPPTPPAAQFSAKQPKRDGPGPSECCQVRPQFSQYFPVSANKRDQHQHSPADPYSTNSYVRTSRSEDQLQGQNDLCSVSVANAEADEDVTSSLNTLLDTRPDSAGGASDSDRIVWTYNAPVSDHHKFAHTLSNGSSSSHSNISPYVPPVPFIPAPLLPPPRCLPPSCRVSQDLDVCRSPCRMDLQGSIQGTLVCLRRFPTSPALIIMTTIVSVSGTVSWKSVIIVTVTVHC
ncbi:hypothetical protein NQ317_005936 [Molorchus minor]|uniref:Uncharacterized protein n=1 Tax=Molorchus minor TaxID=1323400 RepID=A0ABQ9J9S9_9CUCU|nr:hypothetical protein NQ317_005936 [Molorchus minor]